MWNWQSFTLLRIDVLAQQFASSKTILRTYPEIFFAMFDAKASYQRSVFFQISWDGILAWIANDLIKPKRIVDSSDALITLIFVKINSFISLFFKGLSLSTLKTFSAIAKDLVWRGFVVPFFLNSILQWVYTHSPLSHIESCFS